jgi:hypothetical protein
MYSTKMPVVPFAGAALSALGFFTLAYTGV